MVLESVIEVRDLVREYEQKKGFISRKKKKILAVDKISFSVNKGEVFGILGPNGAGKTTIIKMLTTLLAPTSGYIEVLGYNPFGEEKDLRPRINCIFGGERNLYWRITARENLNYFSDLYRIDRRIRETRVAYLLDLVKLTDRADERVELFSKGMKQRLQIARGLVNDPDVLFLDEPTIGLDPIGAKELRMLIKELAEGGKTIVVTTHYMHEADEVCDRIAIVDKGKLVALDKPEELKKIVGNLSIVEITVKAVIQREVEAIENLPYVISVQKKNNIDGILLRVQCNNLTESLLNVCNNLKKSRILKIKTSSPTLEDAYIYFVEK